MTAGPTGVEVRLPTLGVYLATQGSVFAERWRSLTLRERELAFPIFGNSLNYADIIDEAAFGSEQRHPVPGLPGEPSTPLVPLLRIQF